MRASARPLSLSVRCTISFQACSGYLVVVDMVQQSHSHAEPLLVFGPAGLGCGAAQNLAGGLTCCCAAGKNDVLLRVIGERPLPNSVFRPPCTVFRSSGVGETRCLYIIS